MSTVQVFGAGVVVTDAGSVCVTISDMVAVCIVVDDDGFSISAKTLFSLFLLVSSSEIVVTKSGTFTPQKNPVNPFGHRHFNEQSDVITHTPPLLQRF